MPTSKVWCIGTSSRGTFSSTRAQPYVAILAWRSGGERRHGPKYAGTPAYMSPEQARWRKGIESMAARHLQPGSGVV